MGCFFVTDPKMPRANRLFHRLRLCRLYALLEVGGKEANGLWVLYFFPLDHHLLRLTEPADADSFG